MNRWSPQTVQKLSKDDPYLVILRTDFKIFVGSTHQWSPKTVQKSPLKTRDIYALTIVCSDIGFSYEYLYHFIKKI